MLGYILYYIILVFIYTYPYKRFIIRPAFLSQQTDSDFLEIMLHKTSVFQEKNAKEMFSGTTKNDG